MPGAILWDVESSLIPSFAGLAVTTVTTTLSVDILAATGRSSELYAYSFGVDHVPLLAWEGVKTSHLCTPNDDFL